MHDLTRKLSSYKSKWLFMQHYSEKQDGRYCAFLVSGDNGWDIYPAINLYNLLLRKNVCRSELSSKCTVLFISNSILIIFSRSPDWLKMLIRTNWRSFTPQRYSYFFPTRSDQYIRRENRQQFTCAYQSVDPEERRWCQ